MAEKKKMGRPSTKNPIRFEVSISEAMKARLEELAKSERRPMNHVVCAILDQTLGTEGQKIPTPQTETSIPARQNISKHLNESATALLTISLQPALKAAVKTVAKMERRTASNLTCLMIHDWIEQWEANHPDVNVWPDAEEE